MILSRRKLMEVASTCLLILGLPSASTDKLRQETDEWFWICFRAAIYNHPTTTTDEGRKLLVKYCEFQRLTRREALVALQEANEGKYDLGMLPTDVVDIEDRVLMKEDKDRLKRDFS